MWLQRGNKMKRSPIKNTMYMTLCNTETEKLLPPSKNHLHMCIITVYLAWWYVYPHQMHIAHTDIMTHDCTFLPAVCLFPSPSLCLMSTSPCTLISNCRFELPQHPLNPQSACYSQHFNPLCLLWLKDGTTTSLRHLTTAAFVAVLYCFWAHRALAHVGSYASLSVCLSVTIQVTR